MYNRCLCLLCGLLLAAGCTGAQVKRTAGVITAGIVMTAVEIAESKDERDRRREYKPGDWSYCESGCRMQQELATERNRQIDEDRKRRREAARLHAEFDEFLRALETAERETGRPPQSVVLRDPFTAP